MNEGCLKDGKGFTVSMSAFVTCADITEKVTAKGPKMTLESLNTLLVSSVRFLSVLRVLLQRTVRPLQLLSRRSSNDIASASFVLSG